MISEFIAALEVTKFAMAMNAAVGAPTYASLMGNPLGKAPRRSSFQPQHDFTSTSHYIQTTNRPCAFKYYLGN